MTSPNRSRSSKGLARVTPMRVIEALNEGSHEGSNVPQLAARLGCDEWQVEVVIRDLCRKKQVYQVQAKSVHQRKTYKPTATWQQNAKCNVPVGELSGYDQELSSVWHLSDLAHRRTNGRQQCNFGLRVEKIAVLSTHDRQEAERGADFLRGDGRQPEGDGGGAEVKVA